MLNSVQNIQNSQIYGANPSSDISVVRLFSALAAKQIIQQNGHYYSKENVQNSPLHPVLGLYNNFVNPNVPTGYSYLGVEKTPNGDNIHLFMLQNGQRVAIMPKKGTTIVKTFIDSGSMNETDRVRGISHFIEHNLFNGSKTLPLGSFFNETSKMGASTNASTDYAQTDYYIESAIMSDSDLSKTISMHADMLINPLFPNDMIEKEKGPVTSEISMVNDDMVSVAANDAIKNLFQIKSKSDNLVAGSIQTVNSLNRNDVVDYWKRHYTPDNLYTVVVGDVDVQKTMELISKNFTQKAVPDAQLRRQSETLIPINSSIRADYKSPTDNAASVIVAFSGPAAGDFSSNIKTQALGAFLTGSVHSRLTHALEDVNAYADFQIQKVGLKKDDPQAFLFQLSSPSGKEQEALDIFYSTIEHLAYNPPTELEMKVLKNNLYKNVAASFQDSISMCDIIGTSMLDGDFNSISEYKNAIAKLTPYDIQMAAKQYVDLNKASIAVVHPMNVNNDDIMENYKKSNYSMYSKNADTMNRAAMYNSNIFYNMPFGPSFRSNLKPQNHYFANSTSAAQTKQSVQKIIPCEQSLLVNDVTEAVLPDNTHIVMNDYPTEPCYMEWRLTSKESVPENPAVAYILSELLNSGSLYKSKEQFALDAESNGISFGADANGFQISLSADCLEDGIGKSIDTMKEALYHPNFDEKNFKKAKNDLITYFESLSKDASDNLLDKLFGKYFAKPELILEGLKTATLKDVVKHYDDMLSNSTSAFVISAPFKSNPILKDEVLTKINSKGVEFKKLSPAYMPVYNKFQANQTSKILIDSEERNQAQIAKTYSFKMNGNIEDEVKFELLNTILGGTPSSRLFQDLREKQKLAYRVSSNVRSFEDTGILTMSILSTTDDKKQNDIKYDNLQKSLDGFASHSEKLLNELVSEEELNSAKKILKQNYARQTELPDSKTGILAMSLHQPYGIKRMDEYIKTIDKITPEDIQAAARHIFSNKPVYSILASKDTINNQLNYLNSLGEVQYMGNSRNILAASAA